MEHFIVARKRPEQRVTRPDPTSTILPSMSNSPLVIITGRPCTGKTTLGRELARRTNLPFISRDDLKESLFDSLGWDDRDWSKKLGVASFHLLYRVIESILRTGQSIIVETNFSPEFDTGRFLALKQEYGFYPIQILCRTDREVLFERFKTRSESGERHPGHVDNATLVEFRDSLEGDKHGSLDIGGTLLEVDTTDFDSISFDSLLDVIRNQQKSQT